MSEVVNELGNALAHHVIHQREVSRKNKYRDDDDRGGGSHLDPGWCHHFADFADHLLQEVNKPPGPRLQPLHPGKLLVCYCNRLRHGSASSQFAGGKLPLLRCRLWCCLTENWRGS